MGQSLTLVHSCLGPFSLFLFANGKPVHGCHFGSRSFVFDPVQDFFF